MGDWGRWHTVRAVLERGSQEVICYSGSTFLEGTSVNFSK